MNFSLEVENIKCGGCAHRIESQLTQIPEVEKVVVDYQLGVVSWQSPEPQLEVVKQQLATMGYPEVGSVDGLQAVGAKAKSYVSCAIGKMTE